MINRVKVKGSSVRERWEVPEVFIITWLMIDPNKVSLDMLS